MSLRTSCGGFEGFGLQAKPRPAVLLLNTTESGNHSQQLFDIFI